MRENTARVATEGLVAGLLGYLTVSLTMGAIDLLSGRSVFRTAALLGKPLVGGVPGTDAITPDAILAYNGVHLLVFLALGFVAAFVVYELE